MIDKKKLDEILDAVLDEYTEPERAVEYLSNMVDIRYRHFVQQQAKKSFLVMLEVAISDYIKYGVDLGDVTFTDEDINRLAKLTAEDIEDFINTVIETGDAKRLLDMVST